MKIWRATACLSISIRMPSLLCKLWTSVIALYFAWPSPHIFHARYHQTRLIMLIVHAHIQYALKKNLSIPPCLTTVDIVWSRPLCDCCGTVAGLSLNRSIAVVGLYKRGVRHYTIITYAAAASRIRGNVVLVRYILKY